MLTRFFSIALASAALALPSVAHADEPSMDVPSDPPSAAPPIPPTSVTTKGPVTVVLQDQSPPEPSTKKRKRKINVGLTASGATVMGAGGIAVIVGMFGFFASARCHTTWIFPDCDVHPEFLYAAMGGFAAAGAIGTPLLVVGIRGTKVPPDAPPPAATPSIVVGPTSAGLRLDF